MRSEINAILLVLALVFSSVLFAEEEEVALLFSRNESRVTRAGLFRHEMAKGKDGFIRLNTFIFNLDKQGKETLGLAAVAAQNGTPVRINIDAWESDLVKNSAILQALEEAKVDVRIYNPLYRRFFAFNNRNHIKSLIGTDFMIDGDRNMTIDYFKQRSDNNYISVDVLVKGKPVQDAILHDDELYQKAPLRNPIDTHTKEELITARKELKLWMEEAQKIPQPRLALSENNYKLPAGSVRYFADRPGFFFFNKSNGAHSEVLNFIKKANDTLEIMNPYVLLTRETKKAIKDAVKRGVKVTVYTNSAKTTDSKLMAMAWEFHKYELTKMGVNVFELKPGQYIHAKTMVRDGKASLIKSFNLDPRSQNINLENGVVIDDKTIARRISRYNHSIEKKFMVAVPKKEVIAPMKTVKEKIGYCMKRNLQKFVTTIARPIL